ncbi:hypothetical protein AB0C33_37790 [Nonomuraea sp. NPDC048881]|uniref:hypothetical protein n=1 Tax=Nonomuraea sp. NPDC048881 TaxID=3155030 RepID=UPI0033DE477C
MPDRKNELAERRFARLVDQLKAMMSAGLKPEYRGFYGQLILTHDAVTELGELADLRRAARAAGRQLGWHVRTHVADNETLFIIDDRDPPQAIRQLADRHAAEAVSAVITRARNEARMRRTSQPTAFPGQPDDVDQDH